MKVVHQIFEAHATTDISSELPCNQAGMRRRHGGGSSTPRACAGPSPPPVAKTIVLNHLPAHRKFVELLVNEVTKASNFYAKKLLELKFEFLHLLMVRSRCLGAYRIT